MQAYDHRQDAPIRYYEVRPVPVRAHGKVASLCLLLIGAIVIALVWNWRAS